MGKVADAAGIQFRVLNRSKGPAVQGPRAQADRKLYRQAMQAAIGATPNLEVIEAAVEDLIVEHGQGRRHRHRRWPRDPRRRRGAHHRHLPQRPDPYRREEDPGRPHQRGARARSLDAALWPRPAHGPAQDRHAAAPRRQHHRLRRAPGAAGRRSAPALLLPDGVSHHAAGRLPHHPHHGSDARHHRRESRPRADVLRRHPEASARAIARRSRTRWCASRSASGIRSSSSPKASTTTPSIRTASRPRCPKMCSSPSSPPSRASSRRG